MRKKLTPKSIDSLPPAVEKRYEIRDTLLVGLVLRVSKTGGKVWYVTTRIAGSGRRIKIGAYPIISLADAREKAREILRDVQLGRYAEKANEQQTPTLGEIIPQFVDLYAKPRNRDWKGTERILTKFAVLNHRPIDTIKRADIVRVLDGIVSGGAPFRANRALAAVKKLFAWCVDRGTLDTNPLAGLKQPTKERARDRVLSDSEIVACWRAADAEGFPFEQFTQILLLTGQRRGEVAGMRWSELDFELATWTVPAIRAKNANQHVVPLAPLAIAILKLVPRFLNSDLVFTTTGRTPISGFGRLKRRIEVAIGLDAQDWRFHDLRRTAATRMAMMGVQPHIIEAVLNHRTGIVSGVAAVYNRHAYLEEKREALERWATRIEEMMEKRPSSDGTVWQKSPQLSA